jgi:hypothetical protein
MPAGGGSILHCLPKNLSPRILPGFHWSRHDNSRLPDLKTTLYRISSIANEVTISPDHGSLNPLHHQGMTSSTACDPALKEKCAAGVDPVAHWRLRLYFLLGDYLIWL